MCQGRAKLQIKRHPQMGRESVESKESIESLESGTAKAIYPQITQMTQIIERGGRTGNYADGADLRRSRKERISIRPSAAFRINRLTEMTQIDTKPQRHQATKK